MKINAYRDDVSKMHSKVFILSFLGKLVCPESPLDICGYKQGNPDTLASQSDMDYSRDGVLSKSSEINILR